MAPRPYSATLTLRCIAGDCSCECQLAVIVYVSDSGSELVERSNQPTECPACGHRTFRHATANIERHGTIDRRATDRPPAP